MSAEPHGPFSRRSLNMPSSARRGAVDGSPARVNRQGVAFVREEWRVVDRWWTEEPVDRRYFEVVLESGESTVVFRDEERGCWFTQRGVLVAVGSCSSQEADRRGRVQVQESVAGGVASRRRCGSTPVGAATNSPPPPGPSRRRRGTRPRRRG